VRGGLGGARVERAGGARGGLRAVRGLCILKTHSVHGVLEGLGGNETGSWRWDGWDVWVEDLRQLACLTSTLSDALFSPWVFHPCFFFLRLFFGYISSPGNRLVRGV
jgi:hypothetical protein